MNRSMKLILVNSFKANLYESVNLDLRDLWVYLPWLLSRVEENFNIFFWIRIK